MPPLNIPSPLPQAGESACPPLAANTAASLPAPAAGQVEGIRFDAVLRRQLRFKRRYELALFAFAALLCVCGFLLVFASLAALVVAK